MCARKRFCDLNPVCYQISCKKEICRRHLKNCLSKDLIARQKQTEPLPNLVYEQKSYLIKKGKDIDPNLQYNKAVNIDIASKKLNGLIIEPGQVFSFWLTIGNTSKRRGYLDGRVIQDGKVISGIGGGLCNLANVLHLAVVHSPLTVTEFHTHSDALSPDEGKRVPLSSGTSVSYNNIDYRFKNQTDQKVQIIAFCKDDTLNLQLRSERPFEYCYKIFEEDHHFEKQGENYYRISKIYRSVIRKDTGELVNNELLIDNHSKVMYDPSLIPASLIR